MISSGPSLADQAYDVLRGMITSGELAPAERLTERGLAQRLGVSPTPVREAISRLLHERLLVRIDGRTLHVVAPSIRRLHEMSLIHAALSGVAARLAAQNASAEELADLARVHRESSKRSSRRTPDTGASARHEFHRLIVHSSHSPSVIDMIETAEAFGRPFRLRAQQAAGAGARIEHAIHEHEAIVEALLARDAERAEALVREHTNWVNEQYLRFAEEQGLDVDPADAVRP
jgi:DNA-binding GntR family transcriptional regulator